MDKFLLVIILGCVFLFLFYGVNPSWGRWLNRSIVKLFSWVVHCFADTRRMYKKRKRSRPMDTFKFWLFVAAVLLVIFVVSKLLAYYSFLNDAKKACAGSEDTEGCEFKYKTFIPDNATTIDRYFARSGLYVGCRCGNKSNYIKIKENDGG